MSLSDISDLTDVSTDEDVPLARPTSRVTKGPKEYKISHVLRAPRTVQYTAKSLYDQIIENSIDLDPEYQRDVVWQEEKQSGLIDSILRNYYIPPIIFAVTVQDDGSELRTCIDGKQRLTSIQRFIDGQIPHKDSFTNEKLWFKSGPTNVKRKLLPQHLRTQFAHKQVVCVEYTGLTNDQEREIFQRVQLGVALTPAERLQALVGPWSTTIHETQSQVLGEEGFEGYLDWGHTRGRDFQCLATIGYLIENHPKTAIPGTKTLEKWLQKPQSVSNQLRADLHETFRVFVTLARDKKYSGSLNRPTRVSPIEFVMIGVLIYLKRQTLSLTQLSSAIEKMRKDVRASHQDIRSNARVTKHLVEFMEKKIKVAELKSDGEGDKPAALVIARAVKSAKRKRLAHSDDSDTEATSNVKPAKILSNPIPVAAATPSKQASDTSGRKTKSTKMATVAPIPKTSLTAQPLQLSTSRRTTNNSLSNLYSAPTPNSSLPTSATQTSHGRTLPPPSSTSNRHNVHPESTTLNTTCHSPLTVQTGSTVKVESPRTGSLNSPVVLSAVDRLAPIRAAKASLASGTGMLSPPMSNANGTGAISSLVENPPKIPIDPPQNSAVPQLAASLQQPLPPPSAQSLSQPLPDNREQGYPTPSQIEGALQALRLRIPRHGAPAQGMSTNTANLASVGQNVQSNGRTSHPMVPLSMPGLMNTGNANDLAHTSQGYGVGAPHGTYNRSISSQPIPNRAFGPPMAPPWPSSSLGMSRNVSTQLPIMNFPTPTLTGPHVLPQRPTAIARPPSNSTRAEPLGPPSRSTSSESTILDARQGPYNKDRHRPDNRRSHRQDPSQDYSRDKRNWYHSRS